MSNADYFQNVIFPLITGPKIDLIEFLMTRGVLKSVSICSCCFNQHQLKKYLRNSDGVAWRCMTRPCINYKKYVSIRNNSFFENYSSSLNHLFSIIWKWGLEISQSNIMKEIPVARRLIVEIFKKLRNCCGKFLVQNPLKLGGRGLICQIDESLFRYKPKYHRGRATEHELWVFGIVDTTFRPSRGYMQVVEDRSSSTLIPIIQSVIREGSTVQSDEWRAYRNLSELGFDHNTVNHSVEFVNHMDGTHTQCIESYWSKQKLRIKAKKGVFGDALQSFLDEWMWRDNVFLDNFENLLELIKLYY